MSLFRRLFPRSFRDAREEIIEQQHVAIIVLTETLEKISSQAAALEYSPTKGQVALWRSMALLSLEVATEYLGGRLELETPNCSRPQPHTGPCSGWPCPPMQAVLRGR